MATLKDRYVLEIDTEGAERSLDSTRGKVGTLGASLTNLKRFVGPAIAAFAGFEAISGIKNTIDDMDALAKSARLAGAATSEDAFQGFQVLKQAMNEAGVDAGTFERGMLQLNTRLQQGVEGHKSYGEIVDKLGDRIKGSNGELLKGADAMEVMINALNDGTISTEDFAKVVGGRAGPVIQQQFASLQEGATGLAATLADVEANSNIVSLEASENAEVFNDTLGRLQEAGKQLATDLTSALLPTLVELAEGALAVLPDIIEKVKSGFNALKPVFEVIFEVIQKLWPVIEKLAQIIGQLFEIISPLINLLADAFVGALNLAADAIGAVLQAVEWLIDKFSLLIDGAKNVASAVGEAFSGMGQKIKDSVTAPVRWVQDKFDGLYQYLWGGSVAKDLVNNVSNGFETMGETMFSSVDSVADKIKNSFTNIYNSIRTGLSSAVETASTGFRNAIGGIGNFFSGIFGGVEESAQGSKAAIEGALGATVDSEGLRMSAEAMAELSAAVEAATPVLEAYGLTLDTAGSQLEGYNAKVVELNESITAGNESLENLNTLQDQNAENLSNIEEIMRGTLEIMKEESDLLGQKTESLENLNALLAENATAIADNNETLQESLQAIRDSIDLDNEKREAQDLFNEVFGEYADILDGMISNKEDYKTFQKEELDSLTGLNEQMTSYNQHLQEQNSKLDEYFNKVEQLNTVMPDLNTNITDQTSAFQEQTELLNSVAAGDQQVSESKNILNNEMDRGRQIIAGYNQVIDQLRSRLSSFVNEIQTVISRFGQMENAARSAESAANRAVTAINRQVERQQYANSINTTTNAFNAGSGGFNIFDNLFDGFFANGGRIGYGKFGIVGEAGPEIVTGPADVTPLTNANLGGGENYNVTYNINAVDASSFRGMIARDPEFIHAVVQKGAKRRGL